MRSKHICPICGGTTFFTVATVLQEWRVNADGEFEAVNADSLETVCEPDDGNIWTCTHCGSDGVLVDMSLCVTAMQQCAGFMASRISKNYHENSLDVDAVFEETDSVFGVQLRNAVLAASIINNAGDGRIAEANANWAKTVEMPKNVTKRDMISADLTCRGTHIGLADMLAGYARRREKN